MRHPFRCVTINDTPQFEKVAKVANVAQHFFLHFFCCFESFSYFCNQYWLIVVTLRCYGRDYEPQWRCRYKILWENINKRLLLFGTASRTWEIHESPNHKNKSQTSMRYAWAWLIWFGGQFSGPL